MRNSNQIMLSIIIKHAKAKHENFCAYFQLSKEYKTDESKDVYSEGNGNIQKSVRTLCTCRAKKQTPFIPSKTIHDHFSRKFSKRVENRSKGTL